MECCVSLFYFYFVNGKETAAMSGDTGPGMFFGKGTEVGNEGQRIIFVLVNRLSMHLETKRDVNRTVNEIRFFLRQRVKQRQNARRMPAEAKKSQKSLDTNCPNGEISS
jgi:hypothetical protein